MAINNSVNVFFGVIFLLSVSVGMAGCAEINPLEAPREILKHPLGTDPIRVGMTKEEVRLIWGECDRINSLESSDEWKTPKEEWVYIGRYSKIPIDRSYFSKTKYLIFDGDNLVSFKDEPAEEAARPVKE